VLKKILIGLGVLLLALVLVGLVLPKHYECKRKIVIEAEPAKVHVLVGDLKRWDEWAPWKEEDPTIVTTFGPTTTGTGASQSWTGDSGGGRLRFTQSDAMTGIVFDMEFVDGERTMPATGWIRYAPAPKGTEVEWAMQGEMRMPVIGGYFALITDMMIGPMFEKGLAKLKAKAEAL
jgi:hypothetical protein